MSARLPLWYIPHGGGPCFFVDPPAGAPNAWKGMEAYLRGIAAAVGEKPGAILVVSAHWRENRPTVTGAAAPPLIYDYRGFPPDTYELKYPAHGDPALADEIARRLEAAGIELPDDLQVIGTTQDVHIWRSPGFGTDSALPRFPVLRSPPLHRGGGRAQFSRRVRHAQFSVHRRDTQFHADQPARVLRQ